jgi:hypothetical protein
MQLMGISLIEWVGIAQAVILLLTCIVLAWYTIETARIRKQTSVQNTLLAEQLRIMQASLQRELNREASFIKPFFKFGGGQHSLDHASVNFENKGGPAYKLHAKPLESFTVGVSPTRILDTNEKGTIEIRADDLSKLVTLPFELSCNDKLGNSHTFKLVYLHYKGVSEQESA